MSIQPSRFLLVSMFCLAFLGLQACDLTQNHLKIDRDTGMEVQDYRDALAPREADMKSNQAATDIPKLESYVMDSDMSAQSMPLVSVSVNQSIPLRDVLFEIAKQADYDIELDPRIQGSIIFTARNRPLDVVIDRISEIAGLRYKFNDDSLRVELDTPYSKNYRVDFLNVSRKTKSSISASGQLASAGGDSGGGGGGGGGGENGSEFAIDSETSVDTWVELETNLKQILESNSEPNSLRTKEDPAITSQAPPSQEVIPPVAPIDEGQISDVPVTSGFKAKSKTSGTSTIVSQQGQFAQQSPSQADVPVTAEGAAPASDAAAAPAPAATDAAPPAPILQVGSLPSGTSSDSNSVEYKPNFSINKQAGIISVYANERIHKKVQDYIDLLQKAISSQVLIEAKVLEVTLNDQYSAGINWQALNIGNTSIDLTSGATSPGLPAGTTTATGGNIFFSLGETPLADLTVAVQALSAFGTTRALASPRLTVMNNQAAVLNVARNLVYFEIEVDRTTSDGVTTETRESDIKTVPEGILINVVPSISSNMNDITLTVRPTVSLKETDVEDPVNAGSNIPQMAIREFDSVLRMKSGETVVMGGLINDRGNSRQGGLPVLSEAPVFGGLFRNQQDSISKTELVVLIRATVLNNASDTIDNTDRDIYKLYSQDRRPFPIR